MEKWKILIMALGFLLISTSGLIEKGYTNIILGVILVVVSLILLKKGR